MRNQLRIAFIFKTIFMKFKILSVLVLLLNISITLIAQNEDASSAKARKADSTLKLEDMELSNAPAFSLLDISPASIQKPGSTKALATSVVSNLNGGIPQNYALEVTPFWFFKHPSLTSAKYFGFKKDTINGKETVNNLAFSRAQYFSISLAVINKDTSMNFGTLGNHNISLGLRATLLKFYKKKDLIDINSKSEAWLNALSMAQPGTGPIPRTEEAINEFQKKTQAAVDSVRESLKALPLFSLDGAFASNMTFENNSISSNRINRTGVWLNANLNANLSKAGTYDNYFKLYVIGRYIKSKDSLDQQKKYISANLFDYGGRIEFQFYKLSFGYEYIERTSSVKDFVSYRSVGLIQWKVSNSIFITGSFGKNFQSGKNIISALGINWGISNGAERIVRKKNQ